MKSFREFTEMFEDIYGSYIWIAEFDSIADYEKLHLRMLKDEEERKLTEKWMRFVDPQQS